jgi:hypothetical protein
MLDGPDFLRFCRTIQIGPDDDCWPWHGPLNTKGYPRFNASGRRYTATRIVLALRLGRYLKPDERACHSCDNPPCCNPRHLFVGSQADNVADCVAKGRQRTPPSRGANNSRAILDANRVREIRSLKGFMTQREIGAQFGVSRGAISAIHRGLRWSE